MIANRIIWIVTLTMMSLAAFQAEAGSQEQFWLNLPTSPLKIERSPNGRFITLSNYSSKEALKYRLGCVVKTYKDIKVIRKFSKEVDSIAPVDLANNQVSFILLDPTLEDVKRCTDKGAKLAVVEVTFADDSTWKINRRNEATTLKQHDYLPFGEELFAPTDTRTAAMR